MNADTAASTYAGAGALPTAGFGTLGAQATTVRYSDVVGNLRVDQLGVLPKSWRRGTGSVGTYYRTDAVNGNPDFVGAAAGHPDNKLGFAVGAGIKLLNPTWGPGDYFQGMISYTRVHRAITS